MSSGISFPGVHKKGQPLRPIASRGHSTMSASGGGDESARERRRIANQQERAARRGTAPRQLITFVDSQDPNSRSTIQRHTAHHSNAQRRDARLQSLRNTNRPRILRWTRRQSAEVLPVTSPASSHSSSSISPLPPLQRPRPPEEEATQPRESTSEPHTPHTSEMRGRFSPEKESAVQYLVDNLCRHAPDCAACEEIVAFARTDEACASLLLAYSICYRQHQGDSINTEHDSEIARNYLNRGTSLLRARLSDSHTATADANIQAVLLLIAYTADYGSGSFDEVRIHANALRTMIDQRGGMLGENYPRILALQLRNISSSRYHHLTLSCQDPCEAQRRFLHGLYEV